MYKIHTKNLIIKLTAFIIFSCLSFADNFNTNTISQYTTENTWTKGGTGYIKYDSTNKRIKIVTGNDIALKLSKTLTPSTEGSFSINFLPTVLYPSGGIFTLKLIQNASTYYQIKNTDGYGTREIAKYVNSVKVDSKLFTNEYTQRENYTISVIFTPSGTTVEAFGDTLLIDSDNTPITVSSFSIEITQQDAYFDNIIYNTEQNSGAIPPVIDPEPDNSNSISSFIDSFNTDTKSQYTIEDTWTKGGTGYIKYDSTNKRIKTVTGNDIALKLSKTLTPSTEGSFSINFLPTVLYPSGGIFTLKLIQNASTYYQIKNTDGYGTREIAKYINNIKVDSKLFTSEYEQGINYTITVTFSPYETIVEAFGDTLLMNSDSNPITVSSFSTEITQQDAYFDNIIYNTGQNSGVVSPVVNPEPNDSNWIPKALPTQKFNVRNYGLKGDGKTDDSSALKRLAKDRSVTNWYFPAGYTFLLSKINIPSHVNTVFGGANIISKAYTPSSNDLPSPYGAFTVLNVDHNNLLIDNLHFTQENSSNWPVAGKLNSVSGRNTRWYGHITIEGNSKLLNTEIRNCSFKTRYFEFSCIKVLGGRADGIDSAINKNLRIHHNKFTQYKQFAIEIIGIDRKQDGSARNIIGLHLNDNYFYNGGMTLSLVMLRAGIGNTGQADGSENRVYRNKIDNGSWGIETGDSSGLYVYENNFINIRSRAISASYRFIEATGKNFVFNNHMELTPNGTDAQFEFYDGNPDEYYGNYFKGYVYIRGEDSTAWSSERRFGNFHDNTFVLDATDVTYASHIRIKNAISGIFKDNKIYSGNKVSRSFLFDSASGSSNIKIIDNNLYLKNKWAIPITEQSNNPIYKRNNTVVKPYTNSMPIKR